MEKFKLTVVEKHSIGSGFVSTFTLRSHPRGTMTIEIDLASTFGDVGDSVTIQIENNSPKLETTR